MQRVRQHLALRRTVTDSRPRQILTGRGDRTLDQTIQCVVAEGNAQSLQEEKPGPDHTLQPAHPGRTGPDLERRRQARGHR